MGMSWEQTDQSRTHERVRPLCDIGAGLFACGLLPRDWLLASELTECSAVSRSLPVTMSWLPLTDQEAVAKTPQSVRQVAVGVATFSLQPLSDTSFKLLRTGFLGGQVPGRQTVPRAKYVTTGIMHRDDLEQGPSGDLWSILFQLIDQRSGVTDVIKVKSHLENVAHQLSNQNKIGFHHILANSLADVVAEERQRYWPNVWRWYRQTYGQNVVQQAIFMNSNPAQGLPLGNWWTNSKVRVYSDSVLCLEKMNDGKDAITKWEGQMEEFKMSFVIKNCWGSMENQLNSSGIISQDLRHCRFFRRSRMIRSSGKLNLKNSQIGSSSCQCSTTSIGQKKRKEFAFRIQTKSRNTRNISQGHWTFLGPGSLQPLKWWNDSKTGHPVFKSISAMSRGILKNKNNGDTIHFNAHASNTELLFPIFHSVNQLSIHGAVSKWCEQVGLTEEEKGDKKNRKDP